MDFLSLEEKLLLLEKISSLDELSSLTLNEVNAITARSLRANRAGFLGWSASKTARLARAAVQRMKAFGIKAVFWGGAEYPPLLREISDPPFSLFYRGSLLPLRRPCVSVVGTRRVTPDGRRAAHDFAFDAASDGICVVSGLAAGVDGAAHQGAIDALFAEGSAVGDFCIKSDAGSAHNADFGNNGVAMQGGLCTAAVLAGGVDNVFPAFHKKLAASIVRNGGCILSEYPPGVPAEKWRFVRRNRIVAGLSEATVVIQAPPGSGALITADLALGYNRELFFHKACFSKSAETVTAMVHNNLAAMEGSSAHRKIEQRPAAFVSEGAAVLEDYADFCAAFRPAAVEPVET